MELMDPNKFGPFRELTWETPKASATAHLFVTRPAVCRSTLSVLCLCQERIGRFRMISNDFGPHRTKEIYWFGAWCALRSWPSSWLKMSCTECKKTFVSIDQWSEDTNIDNTHMLNIEFSESSKSNTSLSSIFLSMILRFWSLPTCPINTTFGGRLTPKLHWSFATWRNHVDLRQWFNNCAFAEAKCMSCSWMFLVLVVEFTCKQAMVHKQQTIGVCNQD